MPDTPVPGQQPAGVADADGAGGLMVTPSAIADQRTVFVVDADAAIRDSIDQLLSALSCPIQTFGSGEELLALPVLSHGACLISEIQLPGIGGLELIRALSRRQIVLPTILLASNTDVPTAVKVMRAGAVDLIEKPFVERVLLSRVRDLIF